MRLTGVTASFLEQTARYQISEEFVMKATHLLTIIRISL